MDIKAGKNTLKHPASPLDLHVGRITLQSGISSVDDSRMLGPYTVKRKTLFGFPSSSGIKLSGTVSAIRVMSLNLAVFSGMSVSLSAKDKSTRTVGWDPNLAT